MAGYEIFFKDSVWKDIKKIPKDDLNKILSRVEQLGNDPRPKGCEKLTGLELYRIRQGNYRIVYSIQESQFQNVSVWTGSRRAKISTAGIHGVFRGLKFDPNA
jgi:mRNA interferase RelE/StbE